jgi:hypothetical protein
MYLGFLIDIDPDQPIVEFRVGNTQEGLDAAIVEIGHLLAEMVTVRVSLHGKEATGSEAQEIIDELIGQ